MNKGVLLKVLSYSLTSFATCEELSAIALLG